MGKIRKFKTGATRDTKITWKWLGGFFDGEGYAGFQTATTYMYYRKRKDGSRIIRPYIGKRLDVSIAQKEMEILYKIKKFLGYGYIIRHVWCCNSAKARKFLKDIFPYLRVSHKIKQVKKVLKLDKKIIKPRKRTIK